MSTPPHPTKAHPMIVGNLADRSNLKWDILKTNYWATFTSEAWIASIVIDVFSRNHPVLYSPGGNFHKPYHYKDCDHGELGSSGDHLFPFKQLWRLVLVMRMCVRVSENTSNLFSAFAVINFNIIVHCTLVMFFQRLQFSAILWELLFILYKELLFLFCKDVFIQIFSPI